MKLIALLSNTYNAITSCNVYYPHYVSNSQPLASKGGDSFGGHTPIASDSIPPTHTSALMRFFRRCVSHWPQFHKATQWQGLSPAHPLFLSLSPRHSQNAWRGACLSVQPTHQETLPARSRLVNGVFELLNRNIQQLKTWPASLSKMVKFNDIHIIDLKSTFNVVQKFTRIFFARNSEFNSRIEAGSLYAAVGHKKPASQGQRFAFPILAAGLGVGR